MILLFSKPCLAFDSMAKEKAEISGFLNVKYIGKHKTQSIGKRALPPWKIWERHWCSAKKLGPGLGVKIQFDHGISNAENERPDEKDNSIEIPVDAVVLRTQSGSKRFAFGIFSYKQKKPLIYLAGNSEVESQRWIGNIRNLLKPRKQEFLPGIYCISLIDNAHSKSSGLTGLYGDLEANVAGVFIKDPHSGQVVTTFKWDELDHFHLITIGRPEDVKCICVFHTTKLFHGGTGELHVFCLEAGKLLQYLVTQGRGPKNRLTIDQRPISLSEGDLKILSSNESSPRNSQKHWRDKIMSSPVFTTISPHYLRSRSHSRAIENVYHTEPPGTTKDVCSFANIVSSRRISNISIASGIYEEIPDTYSEMLYQSTNEKLGGASPQNIFDFTSTPPPLPPRRIGVLECSATSSLDSDGNVTSVKLHDGAMVSPTILGDMDTSYYVPMSPRLKDIGNLQRLDTEKSVQENDYVIMR